MQNYKNLDAIFKELKQDYPKLSTLELLTIAVQIQRNQILIAGLNLPQEDSRPSALTAIAIQLGFTSDLPITLKDTLDRIADNTETT